MDKSLVWYLISVINPFVFNISAKFKVLRPVPLNVVFRQVLVDGGYVDAVKVLGLFSQSLDDGLSLRHVAGSANLSEEEITSFSFEQSQ